MYRWKFDDFFVEKELNEKYEVSDLKFSEDIVCIYASLDELIKECNFSKKVNNILYQLMMGYDIKEIGKKEQVSSLLDKAINRIIKINEIKYQEFKEYSSYEKIPTNIEYKQCKKCGRWLYKNNTNFKINQEGYFINTCLFCINNI